MREREMIGDALRDFPLVPQFKPCAMTLDDEGLAVSQIILEDVGTYSEPVYPGKYHTVDWLRALDDKRIVGIQVWSAPRD